MHVTICTYQMTVRNKRNDSVQSEFFPDFLNFFLLICILYKIQGLNSAVNRLYVYIPPVSLKFLFRCICVTKFILQEIKAILHKIWILLHVRTSIFTIFFLWLCLYTFVDVYMNIHLLCLWYSMFLLNQIIWFEWKKTEL